MNNENIEICCDNCKHFDERTHFCRLNPPVPIVFSNHDGRETKQNVSSKYPVITHHLCDYCSHYKAITDNTLITEVE